MPFLLLIFAGCQSTSKTAQMKDVAADNKDVIVLAHLIRNHLQKTHTISFTLADIVKSDSLERIKNNFSELLVADWPNVWRGGYVVYFKFAATRNKDSIQLNTTEWTPRTANTTKNIGRNVTQLARQFDGEIHLHYPERHYHIAEIILKRPAL